MGWTRAEAEAALKLLEADGYRGTVKMSFGGDYGAVVRCPHCKTAIRISHKSTLKQFLIRKK